jgi:hypothetical protein
MPLSKRSVMNNSRVRQHSRGRIVASPVTAALPKNLDGPLNEYRMAGAAALLGAALCLSSPALADLNKYEAAAGGEFGNGTALQYGEADIKGKDFHGQVKDAGQGNVSLTGDA